MPTSCVEIGQRSQGLVGLAPAGGKRFPRSRRSPESASVPEEQALRILARMSGLLRVAAGVLELAISRTTLRSVQPRLAP